jgi:two-component system OmpR family sensor kinase
VKQQKPSGQSMTRRLILWLTGAATAFWLIAAGLGASVMHDEFGEIFDGSLQETAERLVPLIVDDLDRRKGQAYPQRDETDDAGEEYLVYQVRNDAGDVLFRSHDAPAEHFDVPLKRGFFTNDTYRFFTAPAPGDKIFVQVADALENRSEALVEGSLALFLPVLLLIPVSVLLIWRIVRKTLAPVDDLRQAIEEKDGGNMAPVPSTTRPRELPPCARWLNRLVTGINRALEA